MSEQVYEKTDENNDRFQIRADFGQASSSIQWRMPEYDDDWQSTCFQVADACHSERRAWRMVHAWVEGQGW